MNYRQIYARKAECETLKNEMEAKEDGNIKQESIGSCKGDC